MFRGWDILPILGDLMRFLRKHRLIIGYLVLSVFMVLALYGGYVADQHAKRAVKINCNFGNQNRQVMRVILMDANKRTQTSRQRSREEKRAAQEFYDRQLQRLKPFDCSRLP